MNGSNSDLEYPEYESEEGLDSEGSAHTEDTHSLFEGLSDAPDLSEDPSESESGGFFDLEDLFETIPYWSANSRSVDPWMESEDLDFETLEFERSGLEDPEAHGHPSKDRQWEEGYLAHESSSRRAQKKPPTGAKGKTTASPARIEGLRRAIYTSGVGADRANVLAHPAGAWKNSDNPYASADLVEARQLLNQLARAAQSATTADEASGLASMLLPVALRLYPQVSRGLWPALPALAASTSWLARQLYAKPQYRSFIGWLPKILESTLDSLAKNVRTGRQVTSHLTAVLFARRVASLLIELDHTSRHIRRRPAGMQDPRTGRGGNGKG